MDPTRRRFLQKSSLLLTAALIPPDLNADPLAPVEEVLVAHGALPVLQGMTDATSTSIVVLHPRGRPLHARAASDRRENPCVLIERIELPGTAWTLSEFEITALEAGRDHQLWLIDDGGRVIDQRIFQSLDPSGSNARFAVVSCMDDDYQTEAEAMWATVARARPDFIIFLGDTVYCDSHNDGRSTEGYVRRYAETRARLTFFRQARLIPSFATWDDHDFGADNADRRFPWASTTRALFRKFWGTRFHSLHRRGFGVGSVFEAFGQRFYLMDDRSERDSERSGGRQWGEAQTEWLMADLERSSRPAWLMNGGQFFGGYLGGESFETAHAKDLADILTRLSRIEAPIAFVSGDVHFSEIMEIEKQKLGYATYEYTSSAIHSMTFPWHQHRARNPRRMTSEWKNNFLLFDSRARGEWQIRSRCLTRESQVSFEHVGQIQRG